MDCKIKKDQIILSVSSSKATTSCPYCGQTSAKVHSMYQREIQDIPMQDKQTILLLNTRKMFCTNSECNHKTFTERFHFVESLHFDELNSYISGLKNDLQAVKNGIDYKYNNGLAEGSVNKSS